MAISFFVCVCVHACVLACVCGCVCACACVCVCSVWVWARERVCIGLCVYCVCACLHAQACVCATLLSDIAQIKFVPWPAFVVLLVDKYLCISVIALHETPLRAMFSWANLGSADR